jgi:hypothetical protein
MLGLGSCDECIEKGAKNNKKILQKEEEGYEFFSASRTNRRLSVRNATETALPIGEDFLSGHSDVTNHG